MPPLNLTPPNSTTQTQTPAVGAQFGLDKAAQQPLSVTSSKVGQQFGLDKAASQPMTVTGNPQSGQPVAMDLNKRSDRRLMRRYIRSQRDNGNIARGINAWAAVRNMRNGQNQYGIQWDSTGHQIQKQNNAIQMSTPSALLSNNLPQVQDVTQKMNSTLGIGNYQVSGVPQNYASTPIQNNNSSVPKQNVATSVGYTQPANIELNLDTSADSWRAYNRSRGINIEVNNPPVNTPVNEPVTDNTPAQSVSAVPGRTFTHERTMDGHWVVQGTDGQKYAMYSYYDYRPIDANTQLTTAPNSTESGGPSLWSTVKSWFGGSGASGGIYMGRPIEGQLVSRKYGGVLKAQQGAQIVNEKNLANSALTYIFNNPQALEGFRQMLSKYTGKEITEDELITMANDPEIGPQLEQLAQQMMKQSAKQGAKLEYISRLRGKCPEGQELVYFAKGGKICSACMGKKMEDGGEAGYMKSFRDRQKKKQMEKCGGKMKKGK